MYFVCIVEPSLCGAPICKSTVDAMAKKAEFQEIISVALL
jgi:hypothetical protein